MLFAHARDTALASTIAVAIAVATPSPLHWLAFEGLLLPTRRGDVPRKQAGHARYSGIWVSTRSTAYHQRRLRYSSQVLGYYTPILVDDSSLDSIPHRPA